MEGGTDELDSICEVHEKPSEAIKFRATPFPEYVFGSFPWQMIIFYNNM